MGKNAKAAANQKKGEAWLKKNLGDLVPAKKKKVQEEVNDDDLAQEEYEETTAPTFIPIGDATEPAEEEYSGPEGPTVVYIGHLPFGFEEYQVEDFFKQFGDVKRSVVARSPKTGRGRGYAFVEFKFPEVAQIAVDTMNDYLMFKKKLVCRLVSPNAAYGIRWLENGEDLREINPFDAQRNAAAKYNENHAQIKDSTLSKLIEREEKKKNKLQLLGINYEFDGYSELVNKHKLQATKAQKDKKPEEKKVETPKETPVDKRKREEEEWDKRKQIKAAADKPMAKKISEENVRKERLKSKKNLKTPK